MKNRFAEIFGTITDDRSGLKRAESLLPNLRNVVKSLRQLISQRLGSFQNKKYDLRPLQRSGCQSCVLNPSQATEEGSAGLEVTSLDSATVSREIPNTYPSEHV
jgi:hypothetical protein